MGVQAVEWTVIAGMHESRSLCGAAVLDDQIVVVGGNSGTQWSVTVIAFTFNSVRTWDWGIWGIPHTFCAFAYGAKFLK